MVLCEMAGECGGVHKMLGPRRDPFSFDMTYGFECSYTLLQSFRLSGAPREQHLHGTRLFFILKERGDKSLSGGRVWKNMTHNPAFLLTFDELVEQLALDGRNRGG